MSAGVAHAGGPALRSHPLAGHLYQPILRPLDAVEAELRQQLQSPLEDVSSLLRHGVQLGGKRLRPAIHLLVAEALGGTDRTNVIIGTVLEMVHTATLIHDDVLDDAATRRHVPTINAQWNNHTSILLGDYLFAQSFRLAATLGSTRTCRWVGEASRKVCEGELRQVLGRQDLELDQATYIEIIQGKTAELCRVACALAAAESGCDPARVAELSEYGNCLGIAFQIADDFLDLWGDDALAGKTLGTDIEQGKVTLPIIRLLHTVSPQDRRRLMTTLRGPAGQRLSHVRPWLEDSDAEEFTHRAARQYRDRAIAALRCLPKGPARNSLEAIANFAVDRSF